ncbi:hypothetical protein VTN49DRAFT_6106 [Thermomyces lanuginosus]|uniref:uncharacterized protein n=1 Tax=Thermomyces lanuginosus TaxID=5541 RepID=UPI003741F07F
MIFTCIYGRPIPVYDDVIHVNQSISPVQRLGGSQDSQFLVSPSKSLLITTVRRCALDFSSPFESASRLRRCESQVGGLCVFFRHRRPAVVGVKVLSGIIL